jgi:hypothetical protein
LLLAQAGQTQRASLCDSGIAASAESLKLCLLHQQSSMVFPMLTAQLLSSPQMGQCRSIFLLVAIMIFVR